MNTHYTTINYIVKNDVKEYVEYSTSRVNYIWVKTGN